MPPISASLLALTRAAADGRGTTTALAGLELAHVVTDTHLYLAFGSTDSLRDLRRSLRRNGYQQGAQACLPYVLDLLICDFNRKCSPDPVVHLAGHSLGGAVARRLAVQLVALGYTVGRLETYGEPRGWDEPAQIRFPGRRYVCGLDPVPWWFPTRGHPWPATILPSPSLVPGPWDHRLLSYERSIHARDQGQSRPG